MDIAGLSTTLATMDIQSKVGTAMLDKALDLGEVLGEGMVEMIDASAMELSVNPNVGANVDVRI
ncbi:MAG: YjfB family protein [Lachnospiraceae bacterium]|nr:YjfB family protein [Lachnospiraceae bacterium]